MISMAAGLWHRKTPVIAAFSIAAIVLHLVLRFGFNTSPGTYQFPFWPRSRSAACPFSMTCFENC